MNFVEERILKDGVVKAGNVLKVDSFLNHQMDIAFIDRIGKEFHRRFADKPITKVLTIESSGIAIAYPVAQAFGVPMVFAKKSKSINLDGEMYVAEVESFSHKVTNMVVVAKKFLCPEDHVLIIDDFMANGAAMQGLISLVESAEATVVVHHSITADGITQSAACRDDGNDGNATDIPEKRKRNQFRNFTNPPPKRLVHIKESAKHKNASLS